MEKLELTRLHDSNSALLSQIAEMTEKERSLREQLSDTEDSFKTQLSELQEKLAKQEGLFHWKTKHKRLHVNVPWSVFLSLLSAEKWKFSLCKRVCVLQL